MQKHRHCGRGAKSIALDTRILVDTLFKVKGIFRSFLTANAGRGLQPRPKRLDAPNRGYKPRHAAPSSSAHSLTLMYNDERIE